MEGKGIVVLLGILFIGLVHTQMTTDGQTNTIRLEPLQTSQNMPPLSTGTQDTVNPAYTAVNTQETSYNMAAGVQDTMQPADLALQQALLQQKQSPVESEKTMSMLDLVTLMKVNRAGLNGNADMMTGMTAGMSTADAGEAAQVGDMNPNPAMDMTMDQPAGGFDMDLLFDTLSLMELGSGMSMGNIMGSATPTDSQDAGEVSGSHGKMGIGGMFMDMLFGHGSPMYMGMGPGDMAGHGMGMLGRLMKKKKAAAMDDSREQQHTTGLFGSMFNRAAAGEGTAEGGEGATGSRKEKLRKLIMMSMMQNPMAGGNGTEPMNSLALAMLLRGKKAGAGGEGEGGVMGAGGEGEGGKGGSRKEKLRKLMMMSLLQDPMAAQMGMFKDGVASQIGADMFGQGGPMNDMALAMLLGGRQGSGAGGEGEGAAMAGGEGGEGAIGGSRKEKLRRLLMTSLLQNPMGLQMGIPGQSGAMNDMVIAMLLGGQGKAGAGGEGEGAAMAAGGEAGAEGGEGAMGGGRQAKLRKLLMTSLLQNPMATQNGPGMLGQSAAMNDMALAMLLGGTKGSGAGAEGEGAAMGAGGEAGAEGGEGGKGGRQAKLRRLLMTQMLQDPAASQLMGQSGAMNDMVIAMLLGGSGKSQAGGEGGEGAAMGAGGEAGPEGGEGAAGGRQAKLRKLLMTSLLQDPTASQSLGQAGAMNDMAIAMLLRGRGNSQAGEGGEGAAVGAGGEGAAEGGEGATGGRQAKLRKLLMTSLLQDPTAANGLMNGSSQMTYDMFGQGGSMNDLTLAMLMGNMKKQQGEGGEGAVMGPGAAGGEGAAEAGGEGAGGPRDKLRRLMMMQLMQGNNAMGGAGSAGIRNQMLARLISGMRGQGEAGEGGMATGEGGQRGILGAAGGQEGGGEGQGQVGLFGMMGQGEGAAEGTQNNMFRYFAGQGSMSAFRQQFKSGEGAADADAATGSAGGSCPRYPYSLMGDTLVFPYVGGNCKLTVKLQFPDVPVGESRGISGVKAQEMSQMSPVNRAEEGEGGKCPTWRLWRVGKYATFIETVPGQCQIVIYAARSNRRGVNVDQVRVNFINSVGGRSRGTGDFGQWSREGFKRMLPTQPVPTQPGDMPAAPVMPTVPQPSMPGQPGQQDQSFTTTVQTTQATQSPITTQPSQTA